VLFNFKSHLWTPNYYISKYYNRQPLFKCDRAFFWKIKTKFHPSANLYSTNNNDLFKFQKIFLETTGISNIGIAWMFIGWFYSSVEFFGPLFLFLITFIEYFYHTWHVSWWKNKRTWQRTTAERTQVGKRYCHFPRL
jgi:hypothetical protein